jgi:hypothetical protein
VMKIGPQLGMIQLCDLLQAIRGHGVRHGRSLRSIILTSAPSTTSAPTIW